MPLLTLAQQTDLVNRKLAVSKQNGNLITFKYHRRVMYDYLWKQYPELLECRGHTYDVTTGELVLAAPTKTFNYLEDGYWQDVPLDTKVNIYKKFNGFMATVSVHNGEVIVGTTGTTNSDYAKMARELIFDKFSEAIYILSGIKNCTWLYEICHSDDPHIVHEEPGAYYLGVRNNNTGVYVPAHNTIEHDYYLNITFKEAIEISAYCKHEGFMVYDAQGNCCKLKSPYYVGKKKLMRMNAAGVDSMYNNPQKQIAGLPDMWYPIIQKIVKTFEIEQWNDLTDQQRRAVIERME